MLFPHRLAEIARARHPDPLRRLAHGRADRRRPLPGPARDGAAVMTFSTYKSYGGPPGGAIVTRDPDVAERVFRAVYPGLTANYDAGRLRGLLEAATRLRSTARSTRIAASPPRRRSARRCTTPVSPSPPPTAASRSRTTSPSQADVTALERAGIYASTSGPYVRLGTQELVTRGFGPDDMPGGRGADRRGAAVSRTARTRAFGTTGVRLTPARTRAPARDDRLHAPIARRRPARARACSPRPRTPSSAARRSRRATSPGSRWSAPAAPRLPRPTAS